MVLHGLEVSISDPYHLIFFLSTVSPEHSPPSQLAVYVWGKNTGSLRRSMLEIESLVKFLPDQSNYWMTDTSQSQAEPEVDSARGELNLMRCMTMTGSRGMVSFRHFGVPDAWLFLSFDCRFGHSIGNFVTKSTLKSIRNRITSHLAAENWRAD